MDPFKLLKILSDGECHSLDSLTAKLGTDTETVGRWLDQFRDDGLEISITPGRVVSVPQPLSLLDSQQILAGLSPSFEDTLLHLDLPLVVDSTNTRAMEWLRGGHSGRALFLAEKQRSGRGRRGRRWESPLARNLTMSLVWPIAHIRQAQEGFSLVVALSLVESMRDMGLQGSGKLRVKWPNDVWLGEAKLAGILLELHGGSSGPYHVVIGVGVNVQLPEKALTDIEQPAGDLYSQGNSQLNRNQLIARILNTLERNLTLLDSKGFAYFRKRWQELDRLQGRQVEVVGHGDHAVGIVRGVSDSGALILEMETGERHFTGGEVAPTVRPLLPPARLGERSR